MNRMELRRQSELAEQGEAEGDDGAPAAVKTIPKAAAKTTRKPAKKKAPARMRVQWGVFNGSMHRVALFDYAERDAADARASELSKTAKGHHFVQVVKEPIADSDG